MANHPQPPIIGSIYAEQNELIYLADGSGKHFFYLYNVLCAKGDGAYTTFYILDNLKRDKTQELVTSHNLGYYKWLLEHNFAQPNQRMLFNIFYLNSITRCNEVQLHYHEGLIPVTPTYRTEFYAQLHLLKDDLPEADYEMPIADLKP